MRHLTPFALFESSEIQDLTTQVWDFLKNNPLKKQMTIPVVGYDFKNVIVQMDSSELGHFDPNQSNDHNLIIKLNPNNLYKEVIRHELTHAFQFSKKKHWNHADSDMSLWQNIDTTGMTGPDKQVLEKFINMTYYFQSIEIDAKIQEFADVLSSNPGFLKKYKNHFFEYLKYKDYDVKKELSKLGDAIDPLLYVFYSFRNNSDVQITQQMKDQFFKSYQSWFNKQYKRFETKFGKLITPYLGKGEAL